MPERLTYGDKNSIHWVSSMNTYMWDITNYSLKQQNKNIHFYENSQFRETREIASNSFSADRFHNDRRISKSFADRIKKEWISDNLNGFRESINLVYIYPNDSKIVAFISLIVAKDFLIIDLIAVLIEFRNKGIGGELIQACQTIAADRNLPLIVGTQVQNRANKLYLKNDFKIIEQSFVFHDTNQFFK
jgi:N-acetylglutamate synthase-like GNAT family acetyltransferase